MPCQRAMRLGVVLTAMLAACATAPVRPPPPASPSPQELEATQQLVRALGAVTVADLTASMPPSQWLRQHGVSHPELAGAPDIALEPFWSSAVEARLGSAMAFAADRATHGRCSAEASAWLHTLTAADGELEARLRSLHPGGSFHDQLGAWVREQRWLGGRLMRLPRSNAWQAVGPDVRLTEAVAAWAGALTPLQRFVALQALRWPRTRPLHRLQGEADELGDWCSKHGRNGPAVAPEPAADDDSRTFGPVLDAQLLDGVVQQVVPDGRGVKLHISKVTLSLEQIPPCHLEPVVQLDCGMVPHGCEKTVCAGERMVSHERRFVARLDSVPSGCAPEVGDQVELAVDPAHANLPELDAVLSVLRGPRGLRLPSLDGPGGCEGPTGR